MNLTADKTPAKLRKQAIAQQWSVDDVLHWSELSFEGLAKPVRAAMAAVYADVLFAERFGVHVARRMTELAPEGSWRSFAILQASDESKHADFFARVVARLGDSGEASPALQVLSRELDEANTFDELLLHSQIIEIAARVIFVRNGNRTLERLSNTIRLPGTQAVTQLLHSVVQFVGRDESRHIAFGMHCLRARLSPSDVVQRHALERRARVSAGLMYGAFAHRASAFASLAWSPSQILDETWKTLQRQMSRLELDIGTPESNGHMPSR
jgi:hypothetical protein